LSLDLHLNKLSSKNRSSFHHHSLPERVYPLLKKSLTKKTSPSDAKTSGHAFFKESASTDPSMELNLCSQDPIERNFFGGRKMLELNLWLLDIPNI
jgi:hypothetical protein